MQADTATLRNTAEPLGTALIVLDERIRGKILRMRPQAALAVFVVVIASTSGLARDHPGLLFEVCNDCGRMVDFGSALHGDYFSITDTYDPLSNRRAFYDAQSCPTCCHAGKLREKMADAAH